MCGIAAIFNYNYNSTIDQAELLSIRDNMFSRGPDSEGLWIDGQIGLGHRRLAILDLSIAGSQPMVSSDGTIRIVFNGEIYNYLELRPHLINKGYIFHSNSDTEVLIYLYQEYEREMVNHLRGMFTFVIWDEKRRGILLARDHFGIKPLYYADNGKTIRIASQVKALLKGNLTQINTSIEPAGHVGFFVWGHVPDPYTIFKGIKALPAGCTLWVDEHGCEKPTIYFNLSKHFSQGNPSILTNQQMFEELQHTLENSVAHHLIADVPVGLFLSSGLDSTTMLALASQTGQSNLNSFTLGFKEFKGTENDEIPLASLAADYYGAKSHTWLIQKQDFIDNLENIYTVMDQPTIDGTNSYFVSRGAAMAGMKVAISGVGGDELFAGYPASNEIPRLVNTLHLFNHTPWLGKGFRYVSAPILKHFTSPKYASLLEYGTNYSGAYLLRNGLFMPWELPEFLDGEIVKQGWQELQTIYHLNETISGIENKRLQISALETSWYMKNQLLRDSDWASMAHSLEVRTPFVDIEVFKCVANLVNAGFTCNKHDMATTPKKPLPEKILYRKKTGFFIPVQDWIAENTKNKYKNNYQNRGLRKWAKHVFANIYR